MKKFIQYSLVFSVVILTLNACYKDKGNYDYKELDPFRVEASGDYFLIQQFDTLKLKSGLVYTGDRSKLKFVWSTYLYTPNFSGNIADTISRAEDLAVPIPLLPDDYWLEFTATDTTTGRHAGVRYKIKVESSGSGLLVLYERNNQVDCDLIKTKLLEGKLAADNVARNLYSQANPKYPLTGDAVAINAFKMADVQYIGIYTSNDALLLSPADLAINKFFKSMFFFPPATKKPQGYYGPLGFNFNNYEISAGLEMMVNDGQMYANPVIFAGGKEAAYSLFTTATGTYQAAPYILQGGGKWVVYDQLGKKFLQSSVLSNVLTDYNSGVIGSPPFNFNNIGKTMVYMAYGYGGTATAYGVFKNPVDDGKRFVYVMDFNSSTARAIIDLSSFPDIAQAKLFTFGVRGQLMYYAVGNKIYQVPFDLSTGTTLPAVDAWPYIPAGEEVTCIEMCNHPGRNLSESALDKYVMVATYNNTTGMGKVYLLQANVTSGVIQTQPAAVYEQFGKVKDISFKL